jgi:hypothetical protein
LLCAIALTLQGKREVGARRRDVACSPDITPNGAPWRTHRRLADCAMMKECR